MSTPDLTNQFISNTYKGVLHAGGVAIPSSGQAIIYDGEGHVTDLSVGRNGQGVTITGPLSASGAVKFGSTLTIGGNTSVTGTFSVTGATDINNSLTTNSLRVGVMNYPSVDGAANAVLGRIANDQIGYIDKISTSMLDVPDSSSNTTVNNIGTLTFNNKGQVISASASGGVAANTITSTTYLSRGVEDSVSVTVQFVEASIQGTIAGGQWVQANLSDIVPATAKGIIGVLAFPTDTYNYYLRGKQDWYVIYSSMNGSNGNANIVNSSSGGETSGDNATLFGSMSQFQSRIIDQKIFFKMISDEPDNVNGNWRLFIIAYQE